MPTLAAAADTVLQTTPTDRGRLPAGTIVDCNVVTCQNFPAAGGSLTATGSPANGNLSKFSGAASLTNGNLSGDCVTTDTLVVICTKTNSVAFAPIATSGSASDLSAGTVADGRLSANVPLLNAANAFTANQNISSAEPRHLFTETDQGSDLKLWDMDLNGGVLCIRTRTDADAAGQNVFCATRGTTTALTNLTFGYSVAGTYTFPFTGLATFSGNVVAPALQVTGVTPFGQGMAAGTGNSVIISCNAAQCARFFPSGVMQNAGYQSIGTKFTTSGCSISATTGGATAGTFTLGANTCTAVLTMNGATGITSSNGWTCQAHDKTAPTILIGGESSSTTTTASITIPAGAGATDVISFSCVGY